jgi:hypothetical protein
VEGGDTSSALCCDEAGDDGMDKAVHGHHACIRKRRVGLAASRVLLLNYPGFIAASRCWVFGVRVRVRKAPL